MLARILWRVQLEPSPRYTLLIPSADDPTDPLTLTVPIKATVHSLANAREIARREMLELSDAEIQVMVIRQMKEANPLRQAAN